MIWGLIAIFSYIIIGCIIAGFIANNKDEVVMSIIVWGPVLIYDIFAKTLKAIAFLLFGIVKLVARITGRKIEE